MKVSLTLFVLGAVLLFATGVRAAQPLGVEDTATEGKGNYLFEFNGDSGKNGSNQTTKLTGMMTAGAGAHTDLSVAIPYLVLNPSKETDQAEKGIGDVRLALKHRIFENEVKQSLAYQAYVDLPEGSREKGLGRGTYWGVMLMDAQECYDTTFRLSAGYDVLGSDLKQVHVYSSYSLYTSFAVEHKLASSYRFLAEVSAEEHRAINHDTGKYEYSRPFSLMAGLVYDISRSWYVDFGVRAGLNQYADDVAVLAGMAWRF